MSTITALHARLDMDASNFAEGANLARNEVNKVTSVMRQSEAPASKFKKEIELLNRAFSESGKQTKQYADAVEFLKRKHGQLPPEVDKAKVSVDQLKQSMLSAVPGGHMLANALKGPAGAALALGAALAVIGREVGKAAQRIDETAKAAKGLGVAYRDLVALQMLASESGGLDAATLNRGMGQFVRKIAEARVNGGALSETLRAIGLDAAKLAGMNPAEAFAQAADAIRVIPDHAERVRVAVALFGKEGIKFVEVLSQGSEGILKMEKEMERLGLALSEEAKGAVESMNDAWGRTSASIQGIWNSVTTSLAPTLTNVAKLAELLFIAVRKTGENLVTYSPVIQGVVFLTNKLLEGFRGIFAVLLDVGNVIGSLPGMLFGGKLNIEFAESSKLLDEIRDKANGVSSATKQSAEAAEELAIANQRAADEAAKIEEKYRNRADQLAIESVALSGNADLAERMRLAAEGYSQAQIDAIRAMQEQNDLIKERIAAEEKAAKQEEKNNEEITKRFWDDVKKTEDKLKELDKAFTIDVESAMKAAQQFFDQERQRDDQRRADVSKGPGAGMEAGSAAAAKFMADQVNEAIGAAAVPEKPTPGEQEIAEKTRELLIAQQEANAKQLEELETQKQLLQEFKQNKFMRIR